MSNTKFVYGNYEDKYRTTNPIARILVRGFLKAFIANLQRISYPRRICEIGCGEGELLKYLHAVFPDATLFAADISPIILQKAQTNCASFPVHFSVQNASTLAYPDGFCDLLVCGEVLEHLVNPAQALYELWRVSKEYVLVSVPNEPIWRLLNLVRGKYVKHWGNTPGHLNHWTMLQFPKFLQSVPFAIINRSYPLPWQMFLLEKRRL